MTDQTPPHDPEAELSVLGTMLVASGEAFPLLSGLRVDDFFLPEHREAWAAVLAVIERKMPVDIVAVGDELKARAMWQRFPGGWQTWATNCARHATAPEVAEQHGKIIAQKAALRRLIALCVEVKASAYSTNDLEDALTRARQGVAALEVQASDKDSVRLGDALGGILDTIADRTDGKKPAGVDYGIDSLQQILGSAKPGQFIIVAARPAEGKSALTGQFSLYSADKLKVPTHLFSAEMLVQEMGERFLSSRARVPSYQMATGRLDVEQWKKIQSAAGGLYEIPLRIDDRSRSLGQITGKIRKWHAMEVCRNAKDGEAPLALVAIDYLQRIRIDGRKGETRDQELGRVSSDLKALAMELQIPILVVAALSRATEKRGGPPLLGDLRECGNLEYDADVVIFIHRNIPLEDQKARRQPGPAELIVAKHRGGPTGVADVYWNAPLMEWTSLDSHSSPPRDFHDPDREP
jgi:replicative DNA helicase